MHFLRFETDHHANLHVMPPLDHNKLGKDKHLVIGDLHGNALKLIYILVRHGIIKNMTDNVYAELVNIYNMPIDKITKEVISHFNKIISNLEISAKGSLHLLGDETADRGKCDAFTKAIFDALDASNVIVKICPSNHSLEFFMARERANPYTYKQRYYFSKSNNKIPTIIDPNQLTSLTNMMTLVKKGIISIDEIDQQVERSYIPKLELVSYIIPTNKSGIILLFHALADASILPHLARVLGTPFSSDSLDDLTASIDLMNAKYCDIVQQKNLHSYINQDIIYQLYDKAKVIDPSRYPLEYLMVNRNANTVDPNLARGGEGEKAYSIHYLHGHDKTKVGKHHTSLDNAFGKVPGIGVGQYNYLHIDGIAPNNLLANVIPPRVEERRYDPFIDKFNIYMNLIKLKADTHENTHKTAAISARKLHAALVKAKYRKYEVSKLQFVDDCIKAINIARVELNKHRSWRGILLNVSTFIASIVFSPMFVVSLGVGIYHYKKYNKFTLWQTNSATQLNMLEKHLRCL